MSAATSIRVLFTKFFTVIAYVLFLPGVSYANSAPDLQISEFSAPAEVALGGPTTLNVTVINNGDMASPESNIGVFYSYDNFTNQNDYLLGYTTVPALAIGETYAAVVSFAMPDGLSAWEFYNYVTVHIDYADEVDEHDEGNNQASTWVTINGTGCGTDGFENDNNMSTAKRLGLGDRQVRNFCNDTVDWLYIDAQAGESYTLKPESSHYVDELSTDGYVPMSLYDPNGALVTSNMLFYPNIKWIASQTGRYRLSASSYREEVGPGNQYVLSLTSQRPDLVQSYISSGTFPWSASYPGNNIYFRTFVENVGPVPASQFHVGVYLSTDASITPEDRLIISYTVDGLTELLPYENTNADTQDHYFSLPTDMVPGTYYIGQYIDDNNDVAENREHNNSGGGHRLDILPLVCPLDGYENDDLNESASILVPGTPQEHNHCDDNVDWYQFNATTGTTYIIETSSMGKAIESVLELFDTDGATFLARGAYPNSMINYNHTDRLEWTAPNDAIYYIKHSMKTSGGNNSEYTILLLEKATAPDLIAETRGPGSGDHGILGGLAGLPLDIYNMGYATAPASTASLYLSSDWNITTDDIKLKDYKIDAIAAGSKQGFFYPSYTYPADLAPGTYYISVIADTGNTVTELNEINNVARPIAIQLSAPPCPADVYEEDDEVEFAKPYALGTSEKRNHCEDSMDFLYVDIAYASTYSFATSNMGPNADTEMALRSIDGAYYAKNYSIDTEPGASGIEAYLNPGRYTVEIRGRAGSGTEYTFTALRTGRIKGPKPK